MPSSTISRRLSCPNLWTGARRLPSPATGSWITQRYLKSYCASFDAELGQGANWTPPQDLVDWMAKARSDGKPIVYIGFGSITVPHPNRVTARIVKVVLKSRSILYVLGRVLTSTRWCETDHIERLVSADEQSQRQGPRSRDTRRMLCRQLSAPRLALPADRCGNAPR